VKVRLDYGREGLTVEVPDQAEIIRSGFAPGLHDEAEAIRSALRLPLNSHPLVDLVTPGQRVVVVHTDITRATPNDRILPVLLRELERAGIQRQDITLLNGLGTHRPQTPVELRAMLGSWIVERYRCLQHNAFDDRNLVSLGMTSFGNPLRVNRVYMESDVRILTGFIEPHLFAGFSGGPKAVLPSLAGAESVTSNHNAANIAHPKATWGVTEGNPIWEEMREAAILTEPDFLLNVTLNAERQISGVFAGELLAAHMAGCAFTRQQAMAAVEKPFDVVVTTNNGYPLDQNLYQSIKGLSAASQIVRLGGAILIATACEDGVPAHGGYADLLKRGGSPQGVLDLVHSPGFSAPDQWQAQIQAMIQQKAQVHVYSDGLTDEQIRQALFIPCKDIGQTLEELLGELGVSIAVLPEGPQTIAYIGGSGDSH